MSFSQTFAFSLARAVDVATATVFTHETGCTISAMCDVALEKNGDPFLQKLGRLLNKISKGHTRAARLQDIANALAILNYLRLPKSQ